MMCCKHPERMAAGACSYSGKFYCEEDLVELDGRMYAKDNMSRVMAEATDKAIDKARLGGTIVPIKPPGSKATLLLLILFFGCVPLDPVKGLSDG